MSMLQEKEIPHPDQFSIVIEQPEQVILGLEEKRYPWKHPEYGFDSRDYILASLKLERGAFSKIEIRASTQFKNPNDWTYIGVLWFRDPSQGYWPLLQRDALWQQLRVHYQNSTFFLRQIPNGEYNIYVNDRTQNLRYDIRLGYEDERSTWIGNVKKYDELLNYPEIDVTKVIPGIEDEFENWKQTIKDQPQAIAIAIFPLDWLDIGEIDNQKPRPKKLSDLDLAYGQLSEAEQTKSILMLRNALQFIEHMVNGVAKAKDIRQVGTLTLRPPEKT